MKIRVFLLLIVVLSLTRLSYGQVGTSSGALPGRSMDPVLNWYNARPSMTWLTNTFSSDDPALTQIRSRIEAKVFEAKATAAQRKRLYEENRSLYRVQRSDPKLLFAMAYTAFFDVRDLYLPSYALTPGREAEVIEIARAFEQFEHIRSYEFLRVRFLIHTLLSQGYLGNDGYTLVLRLLQKRPNDYTVARAFFGPFRYSTSSEKSTFALNLAKRLNKFNSTYWIANTYIEANCLSNIFYATNNHAMGKESIQLFAQLKNQIQAKAKMRKDYLEYIQRKDYIAFMKHLDTRMSMMQKRMSVTAP